MFKKRHPNGFALLLVLVAVAIILVLAATQMKTLFIPHDAPIRKVGVEQRPWMLKEFLAADDETIKLPRSPKPVLTEPVTMEMAASLEGSPRGAVTLTFKTDGRIEAAWDCEYAQNDNHYTIAATMNGNVNVKRTYIDDDGSKDKTRLFFIAKGRYQKHTTLAAETEGATEKGTAWVFGYLSPDGTIVDAFVTIHQTTDWAAAYPLTTQTEPRQ